EARRCRPGPECPRLHPQRGRRLEDEDLHEVLPRPARPVAVAAHHADPGRADPDAAGLAVLDLRLLVLGARHFRPAVGLPRAAAGARTGALPPGHRGAAWPQ